MIQKKIIKILIIRLLIITTTYVTPLKDIIKMMKGEDFLPQIENIIFTGKQSKNTQSK
jgi:hypothetical protein